MKVLYEGRVWRLNMTDEKLDRLLKLSTPEQEKEVEIHGNGFKKRVLVSKIQVPSNIDDYTEG